MLMMAGGRNLGESGQGELLCRRGVKTGGCLLGGGSVVPDRRHDAGGFTCSGGAAVRLM